MYWMVDSALNRPKRILRYPRASEQLFRFICIGNTRQIRTSWNAMHLNGQSFVLADLRTIRVRGKWPSEGRDWPESRWVQNCVLHDLEMSNEILVFREMTLRRRLHYLLIGKMRRVLRLILLAERRRLKRVWTRWLKRERQISWIEPYRTCKWWNVIIGYDDATLI